MRNAVASTPHTDKYEFILFVSGMSVKSGHAVENLRRICDDYLADNFDLKIIDISKDQGLASEYQIVAIPTLIKIQPFPRRFVLGDLSNTGKVLQALDLKEL